MKGPLGAVYVENQGGGGGTIGVMEVRALGAGRPHAVRSAAPARWCSTPMTNAEAAVRSGKDFVPITILCVSTTSIAVHPSVPAQNVKELIAYAKANTGKLSYGSAGTGTMSHLSGELFKQLTGLTDMTHIPYKGAGPGITDLVSGHIPMMSPNITGQMLQLHQTGKIRILAVNSPRAPPAAPNIPTAIEQGVPNMVGELFLGIFAPTGTPQAGRRADRQGDARGAGRCGVPEGAERLPASSRCQFRPDGGAPLHGRGKARWEPVVKAIGLKMQ